MAEVAISIQLSGMAFEDVRHPDRFALDHGTYREVVIRGWWKIEGHLDRIEQHLSDQWEGPDRSGYSIADIYLLVFWLWGARIGFSMTGRWRAVGAASGQGNVSSRRTSRHVN
ncbi:hypothetical protein ACC761_36130 [Rhizobium ruizarguesonis]